MFSKRFSPPAVCTDTTVFTTDLVSFANNSSHLHQCFWPHLLIWTCGNRIGLKQSLTGNYAWSLRYIPAGLFGRKQPQNATIIYYNNSAWQSARAQTLRLKFVIVREDILYLEKLECGHRHYAGHPSGVRVVIDVDLCEGYGWCFLTQLLKKWTYPAARRAPLCREVHHALFSAQREAVKRIRNVFTYSLFPTKSSIVAPLRTLWLE